MYTVSAELERAQLPLEGRLSLTRDAKYLSASMHNLNEMRGRDLTYFSLIFGLIFDWWKPITFVESPSLNLRFVEMCVSNPSAGSNRFTWVDITAHPFQYSAVNYCYRKFISLVRYITYQLDSIVFCIVLSRRWSVQVSSLSKWDGLCQERHPARPNYHAEHHPLLWLRLGCNMYEYWPSLFVHTLVYPKRCRHTG